jgi:putative hydrolase of the HAD superfamily
VPLPHRIENASVTEWLTSRSRDPASVSRPPVCVIFDGDDTLWITERLYDEAREAARRIVEADGLDGAMWETLQRRLDVENIAQSGYSKERFPASCLAAYQVLCRELLREPKPAVAQQVLVAARTVFSRPAAVVRDAYATLRVLKAKGFRIALLTKGDLDVQRKRIADSGLAEMFDRVLIVPDKNVGTIRDVLAQMAGRADAAWMVGNSVRSDILPALEAGLHAIWIEAPVWEHERHTAETSHERLVRVSRLTDVLEVIGA